MADKVDLFTGIFGGGLGTLLLSKLFWRNVAEYRNANQSNDLIKELREEKGELILELESKQKTIDRLVSEKEQYMQKIAKLDSLERQIGEMEKTIEDLKSLTIGFYGLFTHLMMDGNLQTLTEEQKQMVKEMMPKITEAIGT